MSVPGPYLALALRQYFKRRNIEDAVRGEINIIRGDEFSLPTKEWVEELFAPKFTKIKEDLGVNQVVKGLTECHFFAPLAVTVARCMHADEQARRPSNDRINTSLAVGEFMYGYPLSGERIAHDIIFFIWQNPQWPEPYPGNLEPVFFDPYPGQDHVVIPDKEALIWMRRAEV